jgi:hypothetical protein
MFVACFEEKAPQQGGKGKVLELASADQPWFISFWH